MNVDEIPGERQLVGRENVIHFVKRNRRPIMNLRFMCEDKGANYIGYFNRSRHAIHFTGWSTSKTSYNSSFCVGI
jgi:hypothetical protein